MPWWGWIVLGAMLLGAEMLVPTDFYLVFLGLSALTVGLLGLVGAGMPVWLQWLAFAALSVVSLLLIRRRVAGRLGPIGPEERVEDNLIGEIAVLQETLAPRATGRAELRGSLWSVRNTGDTPLESGSRARVERVEGLLLHLRPES